MKIALVCNEYPPEAHGGLGTFVRTYARELVRRGHSVTVIGVADHPRNEVEDGVRLNLLKRTPRTGGVFDMLGIRRALQLAVVRDGVEIIEVPDYQGMLPVKSSRAPIVVRLHNTHTVVGKALGRRSNAWVRFRERRTLQLHPWWIGVSAYAIKLTEQTFGLKAVRDKVVYNPVDVPNGRASPGVGKPLRVLFAGTVCGFKGAYRLAQAAAATFPNYPDAELVYAGRILTEDGIAGDARVRSILGKDLADRVSFKGFLPHDELMKLMIESHIAVLPSSLEFGPIVVLEAMAAGLPVIVGDAGPMSESIEEGKTGFIVANDNPSALAAAVAKLLSDPELRVSLGSLAAESVRGRFSLDACLDGSLAFYSEVLANWRITTDIPRGR